MEPQLPHSQQGHPYDSYHNYEVPSGNGYRDEQLAKYLTPLAIILGSLIIAGAIIFVGVKVPEKTTAIDGTTESAAAEVSINDVSTANNPYIGNENAPVTIAYWTDFQCPFCKQYESQTLPNVIKNYVSTGKVKVVFKDFQFLGDDSTTAALIARSIWKLYPDKYFTWREAMYKAQDAERSGFGDKASIVALTQTIPGIDTQRVDEDVKQNEAAYQKAIDYDRTEGTKLGIQGTPATIIGNQMVPGALAFSDIKPLIEAQLK